MIESKKNKDKISFMVKISIIIPIYNSEKYLKKCIDSVLNQTMKDIEIILINDGSTDQSEKIIDNYIKENNANIIKYNQKNSGQAVARNKGIELAQGEFITFIDSDDYIDKTMLEHLYNEAKSKELDIVICDYFEDKEDKLIYKKQILREHKDLVKDYVLFVAGPCNKIIRTKILKENNIKFPENIFYEDIAIMPALAIYSKKIGYVKNAYYYYVIRENSTMRQTKYNKKLDSIFFALEYLEKFFQQQEKYEEYKSEIEFIFIEHLLFGATGRFLMFENCEIQKKQIVDTMKKKYPKWRKNKYLCEKSIIYKLTCLIFYSQNKILINMYKKIKKMKR